MQWYDGSTWHDLLLHGHTYATNRLFSNYDISLPAGAADNPDFRLRLTTTSSDGYFDSIHLSGDQLPVAPVAYDASYQLEMNQPLPLTLEASDLNNDPLTFQIVDGPNNGSLSGSGDQRTYTPHNNFTGVDTFTFKANDGGLDSNIATVTITVRDNSAPVVNAGPDQTVSILPENLPQPGLWFGEVSGNINATDPNPETTLLVDVASRTEDGITDGITEIFTGQIYDADGVISFTEVIDEKVRIWVNGTLVLSDDNFISRTYSGTLNVPPGWNDLEVRISSGGGGSGPRSTPGIGFNPTGSATWDGGSNWQTLSDPGDGSFLRVTGAGQTISLSSAIVTDPDNDSLNVTWSQISGPSISFDDPNLANTTAFVEAFGVYTLRLTVDDGLVQVYDELTITVTGPLTEMEQFLVDNGLPHDTDMNFDSDGDGQTNLQEFLVMTNPNDPDSTLSIAFNSSGNLHSPISMVAGRFYRICWKATLIGGNWVAVPGYEGTTPSDGSPMSISVDTSGFYRMEVSDQPFAN